MRKTLLITVLTLTTLTGCQGQDGGTKANLVSWDNNGLKIGSIETNGSQLAIGKDANEANARFNSTIRERNFQGHTEAMAKEQSSLTKTLSKQGRSTEEIQTLTQDFLAHKQ